MWIQRTVVAALAIAGLVVTSGCGAGGGGIATSSVNPVSPSYSSLQFAVGTANLYGYSIPRLNVVSTLRQNDGTTAIGASTPTLSGAFTVLAPAAPSFANQSPGSGFPDPYTTVFAGGPSVREQGGGTIFGTPQTVVLGTPACDGPGPYNTSAGFVRCPAGLKANTSTFGQSGGVFAMGLLPGNVVPNTQQAYSDQPYPQPFFSTEFYTAKRPVDPISQYQFIPWGGPPAFDPFHNSMGMRSGLSPILIDSFGDPVWLGVGEGITVFDGVRVRSGSYSLRVAVSTISSSGSVSTGSILKTAHLNASFVLDKITAPKFIADQKGGGSVNVTLPARVTEALVQIVDFGPGNGPDESNKPTSPPSNCQGPKGTSFAPVYFTILATHSGTYHLPDANGPNIVPKGNPKPSTSICTAEQNKAAGDGNAGDDIVVQMIGFDYPAYEAANSITLQAVPQNPPIANAAGQADITISQAMEQDNGSTTQTGLSRRANAARSYRIPR
jgi:hypothetical protein